VAVELSAESPNQLYIPRGFAHGFCTLEPNTIVHYKVDAAYAPAADGGLLWNDESLSIAWPVSTDRAILSDKDKRLPRLRDIGDIFAVD
jgi:dTDP-4-dehydrorhamnose 3,5-epimerase